MSVFTSASTVGWKILPPLSWRLPPVTTRAPLPTASVMCSSTFSTAFMSISGPCITPSSRPLPTFIAADFVGELLRECVVDAVLHEEAVRADAGLPGVAELRQPSRLRRPQSRSASSNTMNGALPPSSSETFFTVPAHCAISCLPTSVEPVNVNLRTSGLVVSSSPIGPDAPGHDRKHALRDAGALGELAQRERRERRHRRGLDHHRAAGGERRTRLARDHRVREIPGRHRRAHADRLLDARRCAGRRLRAGSCRRRRASPSSANHSMNDAP